MPNLIYNLEFKIDKAQLAELKNIVDASTTAEVSSLTDKVKSLEKQLKKLKGSQNELNKTDKERINLSKSKYMFWLAVGYLKIVKLPVKFIIL